MGEVVFLKPEKKEPDKADKGHQFGFEAIALDRMEPSKTAGPLPPAQSEGQGGLRTELYPPKTEIWFFS